MSTARTLQDIPASSLKLLTEIGFIAAGRGQSEIAMTIMDGLTVLRPDRNGGYVGIALAHLNAQNPEEAVRVLRDEALPSVIQEDADIVRAFLALALKQSGRTREAAEELDRIPPDSSDTSALSMVASLRESL